MTPRSEVYSALDTERDYQDRVWGDGVTANRLTIGEFLLNIEVQLTKARMLWADEPKPELNTLEFIRKIGGLAVNAMEQHGAPPRV